VRALIQEINDIHQQGYGLTDTPVDPPEGAGRLFFNDGSVDPSYEAHAAANFSLHQDILEDINKIAASRNGTAGDGSIALEMAQVKHKGLLQLNGATLGEFLGATVAGLGVQSEAATAMVQHQEVVLGHLERLRASVSGVSIDEELTNLIQFQHAYAAAARLVTTIDETIDTIINRMGLVGR